MFFIQAMSSLRQSKAWPLLRSIARPLWPGWVDEGRRIVQGPLLRDLLAQAESTGKRLRTAFNAGAGGGLYSDLLLNLCDVANIIEADLSYSTHSRKPTDKRQAMVAASLTSIPLADNSVDIILCSEVLEHIWEDDKALDELQRILTPGGWLLISVPTPPAVYDPAHVREGYTAEELSGRLAARGLETIETKFCMYKAFQFFLRTFRPARYRSWIVWLLGWLDILLPIGAPMDLIILARANCKRPK